MQPDTTKEWYYSQGGKQQGPVSYSEIVDLARNKQLVPGVNKVWFEGLRDWIDCSEITGLFDKGLLPTDRDTVLNKDSVQYSDVLATKVAEKDYPKVTLQKTNYTAFVWSLIGMVVLTISTVTLIAAAVYYYDIGNSSYHMLAVLATASTLALMVVMVLYMLFYFRIIRGAWKVIPSAIARTTPDRAIWLSFIPFWSIYWNFVAFLGWAQDYNRFIREYHIVHAPQAKESDFQAYAVLMAVGAFGFMPFIGTLLGLASLGALIFFFTTTKQMSNVVTFFIEKDQHDTF